MSINYSTNNKPIWKVGESIKLFNSYWFKRINSAGVSGGFGEVFPVFQSENNLTMMVKRTRENGIYARSSILKEAKILLTLPPHPNILESFIVQKINGSYHIFTEYADGGSLNDLICQNHNLSNQKTWTELYLMINQIIEGMLFLHSQTPSIIHRDLKPDNILIKRTIYHEDSKVPTLKIADFGLSKTLIEGESVSNTNSNIRNFSTDYASFSGFTESYSSPEQDNSIYVNRIGKESDIFTFGIVILELITSKLFFKEDIQYSEIIPKTHTLDITNIDSSDNLLQERIGAFIDINRGDTPQELRNVLKKCLKIDPSERFHTFEEIRNEVRKISNFDENLDILPRTENHEPTFFPLLFYELRGLSLRSLGLISESDETFQKALNLPCSEARDYYTKGRILTHLNRFGEAIVQFDESIKIDTNYSHTYVNKGLAYAKLKQYEKAIEEYDKASEIDPNNAHGYSYKGKALYTLKRYKEGIDMCDRAIEIEPNNAYSLSVKGLILVEIGSGKEAIDMCDRAIEIEPNNAFSYNCKGLVLSTLGQDEEAIEEYDKALEIDLTYPDPYYNKGNSLAALGQDEEAIEEYDKALEIDPKDIETHLNKGNSLAALGQDEEAIEEYDKALEIDSSFVKALYNKGHSLATLGRHKEAIDHYDRVIQLDSNNFSAHFRRGLSLAALGRHKEAIEEYDKASEIDPKNTKTHYYKGISLAALG